MTPAKLKKLVEKLKAGLLTSQEQLVHFDDLKSALMKLAEEQSKFMAQKNPQTFSSWPPEMPERKCSWRLSDELQKYRLRIPEPSRFDGQRLRYRIDQKHPTFVPDGTYPTTEAFKDGEFEKKMFSTEDGSTFYAWTDDGKTPVFPIPL